MVKKSQHTKGVQNKGRPSYVWVKQAMANNVKTIACKPYDPIKDFRRDPTGYYVLIRPNFETMHLEVAVCNKDHFIEAVFDGAKAQDLYEGIFGYEKKHHLKWFGDKGHMAYLGKELKKCELALTLGQNNYFQE